MSNNKECLPKVADVVLPVIKDLSEIKENGFYRSGFGVVKSDSIGLPEFKTHVMPPMTVLKPNGNTIQIMIDPNGVGWFRACVDGVYQNWINLDEVNARLAAMKAMFNS